MRNLSPLDERYVSASKSLIVPWYPHSSTALLLRKMITIVDAVLKSWVLVKIVPEALPCDIMCAGNVIQRLG